MELSAENGFPDIYYPIVFWSEIMSKSTAVAVSDIIFINICWI